MKFRSVIIEDEMLNRQFLQQLITQFCSELELCGSAGKVTEATELINHHQPDIIFLDIELDGGTGFDVLEKIKSRNAQVIFTTAFDHYAIRAIRCSAVDYILKPINLQELQAAVEKAIEAIRVKDGRSQLELLLHNIRRAPGEDLSISLSTAEGIEFVRLGDIIRLEAKGPYTTFFLKNGPQLIVSKNLKEYELLLTEHGFFRVHNSFMVNLKEVKKMIRTDGGYAVMTDDAMIAISPRKKDEFLALMGQRLV
ncbi:MAG: response regulator transcription factor [Chitinophagaceae bacterium]|nr:response regulator transcription factor [Chitinophagaceae bacterium]